MQRFIRVWGWSAVAALTWPLSLSAQVIRDGTVGPGQSVQPSGPDYVVPVDMGAIRGANLFHSFRDFNIDGRQSVTFTVGLDSSIQNILARVTGGAPSTITGRLNSSRTLFLLNPDGLVFGPGAELNVVGSFHASTADYVSFGNAGRFESRPIGELPLLTMAHPSAFGFRTAHAAPLEIDRASLDVSSAISMTGGAITINGTTMRASSIGLAAGIASEVGLIGNELAHLQTRASGHVGFTNSMAAASAENGGRIFIQAGQLILGRSELQAVGSRNGSSAGIEISVEDLELTTNSAIFTDLTIETIPEVDAPATQETGGDILIDASRRVSLIDSRFDTISPFSALLPISRNSRSGIFTSVRAPGSAGHVSISSPEVSLSGSSIGSMSRSQGTSGDIHIASDRIDLADRSHVTSYGQFREGGAGNVVIDARQHINLRGVASVDSGIFIDDGGIGLRALRLSIDTPKLLLEGSGIKAEAFGVKPITIDLRTPDLTMRNRSQVGGSTGTSSGLFDLGNNTNAVSLNVKTGRMELSGESTVSLSGYNGGHIAIQASSVRIVDGSSISASPTGFFNNIGRVGGRIKIEAEEAIEVSGGRISTRNGAGIADGGPLYLKAPKIRILNRSEISTGVDIGIGGDLQLSGGTITIDDSVVTSTAGPASLGGSIGVFGGDVVLINGARIDATANSAGGRDGRGGSVSVSGRSLTLSAGASITARNVDGGDAGSIELDLADEIVVSAGSGISTTAVRGAGGNIRVQTGSLFRLDASRVGTSVSALGSGGNLSLSASMVVMRFGSRLEANAVTGNGGNIALTTKLFFRTNDTALTASSEFGLNGVVGISPPELDVAGTLQAPQAAFLDASRLLRVDCASRSATETSSFGPLQKFGLAPSPEMLLPLSNPLGRYPSQASPLLLTSVRKTRRQCGATGLR